MGQDKNSLNGISPEQLDQKQDTQEQPSQLQQKVAQTKEGNSGESDKQDEPKSPESQDQAPTQDAVDESTEKYRNIALNTFGIPEDKLDDKILKMAKSYAEATSNMTKTRQEALKAQEIVDGMRQVFSKAPSLYEQFVKVAKGEEVENRPQGNQIAENPKTTGKLETVNEDVLVQNGYLNRQDLEGLDDLARERMIAKAEIRFEKDREIEDYRKSLRNERDNLQKETQQQQAQKINKERVDKGVDNYISKYGVDFSEVTDEQLQQIESHMKYIKDPVNPTLIAEDAFEIAANRVLGHRQPNPVRTGNKSLNDITDTGVSVNKGVVQTNLTEAQQMEQQLKQRAQEHFLNSRNPLRYKQKLN